MTFLERVDSLDPLHIASHGGCLRSAGPEAAFAPRRWISNHVFVRSRSVSLNGHIFGPRSYDMHRFAQQSRPQASVVGFRRSRLDYRAA